MPCEYASSSHSGDSRPPTHNRPSGVVAVGGGKNRGGVRRDVRRQRFRFRIERHEQLVELVRLAGHAIEDNGNEAA